MGKSIEEIIRIIEDEIMDSADTLLFNTILYLGEDVKTGCTSYDLLRLIVKKLKEDSK